ncbi:MAG: substrate-binding domain-containing protein [Planctomycetia bacterium]|nr:substrate-binding domain-containing protein [Planctomycetia bacterium]
METKRKQRVLIIIHGTFYSSRQKLRGILRYNQDHDRWQIQLVQNRPDDVTFSGKIARDVKGIITDMYSCGLFGTQIAAMNVPHLCLDFFGEAQYIPGSKFCQVNCDNAAAGRAGANHFLERQYEHFGFVNDLKNRNWSLEREEAFVQTLAQNGKFCEIYRSKVHKEGTAADELDDFRSLCAWLARLPKPAAIMAAMDSRALQVMNACYEERLSVPDDVAVLGLDNDTLLCQTCSPQLSSIPMCSEEAGYYGAQMLDLLMKDELGEKRIHTYGPKPIAIRESTNAVRYNDPLVSEALKFLWSTSSLFVNVAEVAKELRVSRRLLEVRFKEAVGHPVIEEIIRLRIDRVCGLLSHTNYPLSEIAAMCGFSCLSYLSRLFKRRTGKTLTEYREEAGNKGISYFKRIK